MKRSLVACLLAIAAAGALSAENVRVRHAEGVVRGFLLLRPPGGAVIANGDLVQFATGDRVTTRLTFHFRDGSLQEETTVFSQRRQFRLLSDHLVQRGSAFPRPMDVSINATTGRVVVKHRDKDGEEKTIDEQMELPADLANGVMITLLKNLSRDVPATAVSMLFATPKPQLVKLVITRAGEDSFSVGRASYKATRFNIHVEIGGLKGVLAKLFGKQPLDTSVWVLGGDAPGFVRSEGQFYQDGPVWRIELAAPDYPRTAAAR
jgi:hypothetical protein